MDGEFEEVGYEQLSDPKNFYYDPEWYLICEIPDDDPWFWIVSRFLDGKSVVKSRSFKALQRVTVKKADSKLPKIIVEVSGDELRFYVEIIEEYLRRRELSATFLQHWGEFERCFAKFEFAEPALLKRQNSQRQNSRSLQKQWYSLWVEQRGSTSRKALDAYIEELCDDILNDRLLPLENWEANCLRSFVADMADSIKSSGKYRRFSLSTTYDKTNLGASEIKRLAEIGRTNKKLPPVGSHYFIKK